MVRQRFWRRHRASIASGAALSVAAGTILAYALAADGYTSHETRLNDGGIWVTNDDDGAFGRVNKPIDQLDALVFGDQEANLDIVQDGAAVVGVNTKAGLATGIDGANGALQEAASASVPVGGDLQLLGGTLASLDRVSGEVWAVRVDPETGLGTVGTVDSQADPLAEAGESASLAVTETGTVVVVSADDATLTTIEQRGDAYADPVVSDLPAEAGSVSALTSVGERVVTLDPTSGALQVLGGASAQVPTGGVLQLPGPAADSVLVATPESLLEVELTTGEIAVVADGVSGTPTEPVRLGACVFGAWSGGQGLVATVCGDAAADPQSLPGQASDVVFRVNRGEILLNDRATGTVWNVDQQAPVKIDNWNAFTRTQQTEEDDEENEENTQADRRPPRAKPDRYGARPGRTTVLHPLDNDSAPEGRLLAIRSVEQPGGGGRVTISPDGQTLQLALPDDATGSAVFRYVVDDGRSLQADASVTVQARSDLDNGAPDLRRGFEARRLRVPAGGSVSVPVLADWRDDADGDPLVLDSATALSGVEAGALARTTTAGEIRFTAPSAAEGGSVRVEYAVTDGRSQPVTETLTLQVQGRDDQQPFAADAQPDVVSGEVGQPVVVKPLANDLPGSDPSSPNAVLGLGGRVAEQAGARVRTDLVNGVVTLRSDKAGTYFLDYAAGYGNAPLSRSKIRVDVRPAADDVVPVTVPDTVTIYGQAAATVDVLANDVDPGGGLLVVQKATADRDNQVDVAVVSGRWLRVSARQGELAQNPQLVRYTVTNGARSVQGELTVSQRPVPVDNSPVTAQDRVVVRAGSSVTAAVLDNDFSPSGDRLELVTRVEEAPPGELAVVRPGDVRTPPGQAFVSGRVVRYVAPDVIEERDNFEVPYVAVNSTGETAEGRLVVTVVPTGADNDPPEPPTLEGRAVSGDTLDLKLPGTDLDPDGDPVTVTGIASAPRLGRIVAFGANSLQYQAFPGSVGTDEFTYTVVDALGAQATGTARVAIVPPGTPQPPLAVADTIRVAPGRQAVVDVLANDVLGARDRVTISLVDPPEGVTIDEDTDRVQVRAAARADDDDVQVVYRIDNGVDASLAALTVVTTADVNNPPVVFDAFGTADDSDRVTVDVLEGAYDPDGPAAGLAVAEVYADETIASTDGGLITVSRTAEPQVVPFRVADADGAMASASLYVPPTGNGAPYVREDALIELEPGDERRFDLADYLVDPSGGTVRLAAGNRSASGSPVTLSASAAGTDGFRLAAGGGYTGPAAALLEVTSGPPNDANAPTTLVSVPVQIGDDKPVLTCPVDAQELTQSQQISVDVTTYCNVWTMDPAQLDELTYDATWETQPRGLEVTGSGGRVLSIGADGGAETGEEGVLSVTAAGSDPALLRFRVRQAPSPSLLPVRVPDMRPGSSRTLNLATYLRAGVGDPEPTIVDIAVLSGRGVSASGEGGAQLTLDAAAQAEGRTVLRVVMSDVSDPEAGPGRRVEGRIELDVLDVPDAPGTPFPAINVVKGRVPLSWQPPDDNGSPIDHYVVRETRSGATQRCVTNRCDFTGLANGARYNFDVRAHNKAGYSAWSDASRSAVADTIPDRVQNIRMVARGPNTFRVKWTKPPNQTSPIEDYTVVWEGGTLTLPRSQTEVDLPNLDNNRTYTVSISARNGIGRGPVRVSEPYQSLGTPLPPGGTTATDLQAGNAQTTIGLSWAATLPEGPGPTTYTVYASRNGSQPVSIPGCNRIEAATCNQPGVAYDGTVWTYTVRAYNQPGNSSVPGAAASFDAIGKPANWGAWSWSAAGQDQTIAVSFVVPESRGVQSNVAVLVNGGVARDLPESRGAVSTTVALPTNEAPASVQLRVCNENVARAGCSVSDVKTVQSYGPLSSVGSAFRIQTESVDGKTIRWRISGSNNGDPAVVDYQVQRSDGTSYAAVTVRTDGPGAFSFVTDAFDSLRFNDDLRIFATQRDDNPVRGEVGARADQRSAPPPPPTVTLSRGSACNDTPNSGPACARAFQTPCVDVDCGYLRLSIAFVEGSPDWDCQIANPDDVNFRDVRRSGTGAADFETDIFYGGGQVTATCDVLDGGTSPNGSGTFTWPNTG